MRADVEAALREAFGFDRRGFAPLVAASEVIATIHGVAGVDAVDLIVFATMTPDVAFPGSGCYLQDKLGCQTVGALDVRAQCAGFLFALATADRFLRAGAAAAMKVLKG